MKKLLFIIAGFAFIACGSGDGSIDQTKPEEVVKAIFKSAKSGNFEMMKNLCDPKNENDGDTRDICQLVDKDIQKEFVKYFKNGKLNGETQVKGDKAIVPFLFGPNGEKEEEMKLIKRDGKWYLYSF